LKELLIYYEESLSRDKYSIFADGVKWGQEDEHQNILYNKSMLMSLLPY